MERGRLEIIAGPMFAGKTTELIRRHQRLNTIGRRVVLINHASNTRNDATGQSIHSHNDVRTQGSPVLAIRRLQELSEHPEYRSADTVMIDEAQFFEDLEPCVMRMVEVDHRHVIVSGLLSDANRRVFGGLHKLVHHADSFTLLSALCKQCSNGTPGIYTRKKRDVAQTIGGSELYETVCRRHYQLLNR